MFLILILATSIVTLPQETRFESLDEYLESIDLNEEYKEESQQRISFKRQNLENLLKLLESMTAEEIARHQVYLFVEFSGDEDALLELLKKKIILPDTSLPEGLTPLHIACSGVYRRLIKELISLGADLNSKDNKGNTPLGLFGLRLLNDVEEIMEDINFLLERGARCIIQGFDATSLILKIEKGIPQAQFESFALEHKLELSLFQEACHKAAADEHYLPFCTFLDSFQKAVQDYRSMLKKLRTINDMLTGYERLCRENNLSEQCDKVALVATLTDVKKDF